MLETQPKGEIVTIDFLLDKAQVGEDMYQFLNVDGLCLIIADTFDCDVYVPNTGSKYLIRIKGVKNNLPHQE